MKPPTLVALLVCASLLVSCGDPSDDAAGNKPSPSPTSGAPTSPPSSTKTPSPVPSLEARDLLLDDEVEPRWKKDKANVPADQPSTQPQCTNFIRGIHLSGDGVDAATRAWRDPNEVRVTALKQIVRLYDDESDARAFVRSARSTWSKCKQWEEGPNPGQGFPTRGLPFDTAGLDLGDEVFGWRESVAVGDTAASTIWIAVRTGPIVQIVEATGMDDSIGFVEFQVLDHAKKADRRVGAAVR